MSQAKADRHPSESARPEPVRWLFEYSPYTRMGEAEVEIPAFEIFEAGGEKIADTNESRSCSEQEQHAALIAAAPELLEVVATLAKLVESILGIEGVPLSAADELERARAVIAKAAPDGLPAPSPCVVLSG